eukprot:6210415-Pleurochrysis_carterae.AAC.3
MPLLALSLFGAGGPAGGGVLRAGREAVCADPWPARHGQDDRRRRAHAAGACAHGGAGVARSDLCAPAVRWRRPQREAAGCETGLLRAEWFLRAFGTQKPLGRALAACTRSRVARPLARCVRRAGGVAWRARFGVRSLQRRRRQHGREVRPCARPHALAAASAVIAELHAGAGLVHGRRGFGI